MEDPVLEFKLLNAVQEERKQMTQRHLSQRLGRSVSSVNFALRLLAAKGLLKISGIRPKRLVYHITSKGVAHKAVLAYDFVLRQSSLYEEVRNGLIEKLKRLHDGGTKRVAIYGWTPVTETAILYLMVEGIQVAAIYVPEPIDLAWWNSVPFRLLERFKDDCDILLLLEPLPQEIGETIGTKTMICFPESGGSEA